MLDLLADDSVLETERLRLEPLLPEHAAHLFPVLADPRLYTYIPEEPMADQAALRQRYQRLATRHSPQGDELWLKHAIVTSIVGRVSDPTTRVTRTLLPFP